jgi:hypothetical protein
VFSLKRESWYIKKSKEKRERERGGAELGEGRVCIACPVLAGERRRLEVVIPGVRPGDLITWDSPRRAQSAEATLLPGPFIFSPS